ncbi:MAG: GTP-binding protein [Desulfovibrio sp.]|uniref:GTP-binding protein n=1 Tax=Desulfovibrio sp. 7SRBS1 TaxID=3378064 RepID=UPI003B4078A7
MKILTVAGAPSAGKTSVILHLARALQRDGLRPAAVKFDTLGTTDDRTYRERLGIPAIKGLSDYLCPDHYFVSNLEEACTWGADNRADVLFIETAGLCYRCAPHVTGLPALTVIDNLGGMDAPRKMGPALALADVVVVTKSDLVSQAEKEVFAHTISRVNPKARVVHVNGLTGTGVLLLQRLYGQWPQAHNMADMSGHRLRYSMPASICSYCTGETRIGKAFQSGNVEKLLLAEVGS